MNLFVFCRRCCYTCANEKEIEWRVRIQENLLDEHFDEKLNYLKSLQQCLANLPLSLYYLLCAINQYQSQYNKRLVRCFFLLLKINLYQEKILFRYLHIYFTNI